MNACRGVLLLLCSVIAARSFATVVAAQETASVCAATLLAAVASGSGVDLDDVHMRSEWLRVELLADDNVPVPLYRAHLTTRRPGYIAKFVLSGAQCTLVGGDPGELLRLPLHPEAAFQFSISQYNAAILLGPKMPTADIDPTKLARSVLQLASPKRALIIQDIADIPRRKGARLRGNVDAALRSRIRPASVKTGQSGVKLVTLFSWDEIGGVVWQNDFVINDDSTVAVGRTLLDVRVGAYQRSGALL
jgi:hypothetical protein